MSAKFVKNVFISLLEMSNVYDLMGQPSFIYMCVVKLNLLKNGGFQLDIIISSLLYFLFFSSCNCK